MVLQDDSLVPAQCLANAVAFAGLVDHAVELLVDAMVLIEHAGVLRERLQWLAKCSPCLAVGGMRVRSGHDVGPVFVQRRMNGEGRAVQRPLALHDFALVVDQQQVRHLHLREVHAQRG